MPKNLKYTLFTLTMIILTGVIWLVWVCIKPDSQQHFLSGVSKRVEGRFFNSKKRRSATRNNK